MLRLAPEEDEIGEPLKFHAWICIPDPEVAIGGIANAIEFIVYPVGLAISELFFLATFIAYCMLPELRDVMGKCVMSNIACLFVAYILLIIMKTSTGDIAMGGCIFIGK